MCGYVAGAHHQIAVVWLAGAHEIAGALVETCLVETWLVETWLVQIAGCPRPTRLRPRGLVTAVREV